MRPKSVLIVVALVIVLVIVVAVALRNLVGRPSSDALPQAATVASQVDQATSAATPAAEALIAAAAHEPSASSPAAPDPALTGGIEGLYLQLSRALTVDLAEVRGLAATDAFFYIATVDTAERLGMVVQTSREHYGIVQTRAVELDGRYRVGGLHMGAAGLWVPLAGDGDDAGSTIALLDAGYLEVQSSFAVEDRIRAVAQIGENQIVGVNESGERLFAWNAKGRTRQQVTNLTGTVYHDLAWISGSLVAAGVADGGTLAVLDVLDPDSLTLLARHRVYALSGGGHWVTVGGFDAYGDEFFLLAEGGVRPSVFTYALLGGALDDYVPATSP